MGDYGNKAPEAIPDAYVTTASFPIPQGQPVVYGGRWRIEGKFPNPHIARAYCGGEPLLSPKSVYKYQIVLDLSSLPAGTWQAKASVIPGTPGNYEFVAWVRPRSGRGEGDLEFDDVFSFVLPVQ
jgi:hypothetical protein